MRATTGLTALLLVLAACDRQPAAPVAPLDEIALATSVSSLAQAAMAPDAGGQSILRNLVQQIRAGDNERAKAQIARAMEMSREAASTGNRELARQAHVLVIQTVAAVFPNAATRIANATRAGLERARAALAGRDAPRLKAVLDQVAGLLRQSAAAQEGGRGAIALELALNANDMLGRLVDHVRGGTGTTPTGGR